MVIKELTDLIPILGLYDVYRRKDDVLNFHANEALKENDRARRLARLGEIEPAEQKQRCENLLKEIVGI